MPDLTLSVTAAQWTQIQAAFTVNGDVPDTASMVAWIKTKIRHEVEESERKKQAIEAEERAQTALSDEGWN
tara:strand:+ start:365 stop:577 length:213 start_codon:yes stop_codon:yes gene_type:complete